MEFYFSVGTLSGGPDHEQSYVSLCCCHEVQSHDSGKDVLIIYVEKIPLSAINFSIQKYKILYQSTRIFQLCISILAYVGFQFCSDVIKLYLVQWNQHCDVKD